MTTEMSSADRSLPLDRYVRDDWALDAAGQGLDALLRSEVDDGDPVLRLLANWRDDLAEDVDTAPRDRPAGAEEITFARIVGGEEITKETTRELPAIPAAGPASGRRRTRRRASRLVVAAGIAAFATLGFAGVAVAASNAQPGSALWPVTEAVYPEVAASRVHEVAARRDLQAAQNALADGHPSDARRYLRDARQHCDHIQSDATANRLRTKADQVGRRIDARSNPPAVTDGTRPSPAPPTASASASPSPSQSARPSPSGSGSSSGQPSPSGSKPTTGGTHGTTANPTGRPPRPAGSNQPESKASRSPSPTPAPRSPTPAPGR